MLRFHGDLIGGDFEVELRKRRGNIGRRPKKSRDDFFSFANLGRETFRALEQLADFHLLRLQAFVRRRPVILV